MTDKGKEKGPLTPVLYSVHNTNSENRPYRATGAAGGIGNPTNKVPKKERKTDGVREANLVDLSLPKWRSTPRVGSVNALLMNR